MTIEELYAFTKWNLIIGLGLYVWTALFVLFGRNFMIKIHKEWFSFPFSKETIELVLYGYLAVFKIFVILFLVIPYMSLAIMV